MQSDFLSDYVRKLSKPGLVFCQQEVMVSAFIAQHTLHLDLASHLVKLTQALSSDHKALQTLSMEHFSDTYKFMEQQGNGSLIKMKTIPLFIKFVKQPQSQTKKGLKHFQKFDRNCRNMLMGFRISVHQYTSLCATSSYLNVDL